MLQAGRRGSAVSLWLAGSVLVNVVLVSFYASQRHSDRSSLLQADTLKPALQSTLASLEARLGIDGRTIGAKMKEESTEMPSQPPATSRKTEYEASLKAAVDSSLLQGLAEADKLQVDRLIKREQALRAADSKLAKPTTAGGNVKLSTQQPEHQQFKAHFEWGTVNPDSGMQRLTCSDSLADASGNGAPKNRFWGGALAGKSLDKVDACAPGEPCNDQCARMACNVGEIYQVECPANCLKQELGGDVFGAGTTENPFMDLSSVCRAALAAGVSNDRETNIVAFKVVTPAHSYTGLAESKAKSLVTLDYSHAKAKFGGGSWYGVRAFVFVPASEAIQVATEKAVDDEGHMALSKKKSMKLAETGDAHMPQLAKLEGGQENMAIYFDGTAGTMLTYEGAGAALATSISGGITVEAWVYDSFLAIRSGYVGFFQDQMGSSEAGGGGIWQGPGDLAEEDKDYGFVLGTDEGAFSWAVASTDTLRLDYLSAQACSARRHVGSWVHVAGTYDGAVMKLFVDGKAVAVGYTQSGPIAWPSEALPAELTMGAWLGLDKQTYFNGLLDEVRIWAVALSEEQIGSRMHQTLAPPVPAGGLTMYWRFDRAYCDEINWALGKVAFNPDKSEMELVPRVASGANVELMSVSWACLAECGAVVAPLHGGAYPSVITHEGDTVSVYCDQKYELRCGDAAGSDCATLTCQNDGEGNGVLDPASDATCIGVCSSYPAVANGEVTPPGSVYVGDMIEISCKPGYELNAASNSPATCVEGGAGGVFDKTGAACIAVCEAYGDVAHGSVDPAGPTHQNEQVTITCDEGYELVDSVVSGSPATCIDGGAGYGGGMYDKPKAECKAKCSAYPAVEHGQISPAGPVWVDTVVAIACKSGYVLKDGSPTSATCIDTGSGGDYDAQGAQCIAVCAAFPSVEHGTVSPAGEVHAGDKVNVVCDAGYVLADGAPAFEATCMDSGLGGEFNKGPPTCIEAPVYCAAVSISQGTVSPYADVPEGGSITVMCNPGFHFDEGKNSPFMATCIKDEGGGHTVNGVQYSGIFDKAIPMCVPDIKEDVSPNEVEMAESMKGLNMECAKWRNNKDGVGNGNNLSLKNQFKQMAYCMQQDCQRSMDAAVKGCRFTDANRLCYSLPGQVFCLDHAPHSMCKDLGKPAGDTSNLGGPGTWEPLLSVPVFGTAALTSSTPYSCNCFKNCAHFTGSNALKKYRCTGGKAIMVGAIAGSPAEIVQEISSATKNGECACSCGYVGDTKSWEAGDPQK